MKSLLGVLNSAMVVEGNHGQPVNEWTCLCSYKIIYQIGSRLDLALRGCSWLTSELDYIGLIGHGRDFRFYSKGEKVLINKFFQVWYVFIIFQTRWYLDLQYTRRKFRMAFKVHVYIILLLAIFM